MTLTDDSVMAMAALILSPISFVMRMTACRLPGPPLAPPP